MQSTIFSVITGSILLFLVGSYKVNINAEPMFKEEKEIAKHLSPEWEKIGFMGAEYLKEQLDGVGNKELIVPFKEKDIEKAVFLLIISYDDNNSISYKLKGDGEFIERLDIVDINKDNKNELLFGTKIGAELFRLNVFSFSKGNISREFSYPYSKFEILNGDAEKNAAMAFWVKDSNNCYKVSVVRWNGSELVEALDLRKKYFPKVAQYYGELTIKEKDNAYAWYYLADAQIKSGYKKEALKAIARGVSLNKDYPTKQEFEELKKKLN